MSAVKLPVTRPAGRALLVGGESSRQDPLHQLTELGFQCDTIEDPYEAMAEVVRHPRQYGAVVLSLLSLYREELQIISTLKQRFAHIEIWLTQTDGRATAMAEAMRLGADGLLTDEGLHRTAVAPPAGPAAPVSSVSPVSAPLRGLQRNTTIGSNGAGLSTLSTLDRYNQMPEAAGEPLLSAEELKALLQDAPAAEESI